MFFDIFRKVTFNVNNSVTQCTATQYQMTQLADCFNCYQCCFLILYWRTIAVGWAWAELAGMTSAFLQFVQFCQFLQIDKEGLAYKTAGMHPTSQTSVFRGLSASSCLGGALTLFLNVRFQMQHIQSSPKRPRILNRCGRRPRLQNRRHAPNIRNPKI